MRIVREPVKELGQGTGIVNPALQPVGMPHRHRRRSLKVTGAKGIAHLDERIGGTAHLAAFGGAAPADRTSRLAAVRIVFTAYLLLITVILAFYIAIGITNHQ